jgi:hypothetical protein
MLGSLAIFGAARQHQRFCRSLTDRTRPHPYHVAWSIWFSLILAVVGMVLATYLLLRAEMETESPAVAAFRVPAVSFPAPSRGTPTGRTFPQ